MKTLEKSKGEVKKEGKLLRDQIDKLNATVEDLQQQLDRETEDREQRTQEIDVLKDCILQFKVFLLLVHTPINATRLLNSFETPVNFSRFNRSLKVTTANLNFATPGLSAMNIHNVLGCTLPSNARKLHLRTSQFVRRVSLPMICPYIEGPFLLKLRCPSL